eukprot:maker-scaffold179_size282488-snap-gene-1.25 protein:Tk10708 transcript:maker-scaffold179_size282488-snap-gene-1.25-mRNA-1 annotation:"ankyrin repeat and kh domain-containing protein 1"
MQKKKGDKSKSAAAAHRHAPAATTSPPAHPVQEVAATATLVASPEAAPAEVEPIQFLLDSLNDSCEDHPGGGRSLRRAKKAGDAAKNQVDPETQSRLEALLEAAGIGSHEESNTNLSDPEVLKRLTSSVSSALDEAAAALTRMRSDPPAEGRTLVEACTEGDIKKVRKLLHEGRVSVHDTTEEGESLLSLACSAGYLELAQVLIAMRANIEDRGLKGDCTPLMEAASAGHLDIVKLLINHSADVNAQSQSGNTPLMHACAGGHEAVVKALLEAGANVEDHNENGHTPLMEAASAGHVGVAKILLKFGAGINTHSNEFKESALTLACYKGHLEMVRFLLDAGADQEHKTDEMHTALMEASMDGHVEVAKLLLDHGAQVNMPADSFESPLTLAACGGHVDLAMLLLERGANIEEVNDEGYTPLMEASREGHEEMVALLLSQGADINAQTEETQETALTLACCGGFLEVADFLIKAGADIELGASTPLMEASQEGHLDLVRYLLEAGANVNAVTTTSDTALTYACENGHTDVADLLLNANAELEHESEGGRTPLMKAARSGHLSTVKFLIEKGADVSRATSNNDHTPLSLACGSGHQGVVEVLLHHGADPYHKLKDNSTMLIEAAKGGHTVVVQILIDYPNSDSDLDSPVHMTRVAASGALPAAGDPNGGEKAGSKTNNATVSLPVKSVLRKNQRGGGGGSASTSPNVATLNAKDASSSSGGKVAKTNNANNASSSSLLHAADSGYDYIENSSFVLEGLADKGLDAKSYIQSMLNRAENATKEEQIQQKEQILAELQRVERELQEKAQAQQKLAAASTPGGARESGEGSSNPPKAVSESKSASNNTPVKLQTVAAATLLNHGGGDSSSASEILLNMANLSIDEKSSSGPITSASMLSQRALANMPPSERPKAKPSRKIEKGGAKKVGVSSAVANPLVATSPTTEERKLAPSGDSTTPTTGAYELVKATQAIQAVQALHPLECGKSGAGGGPPRDIEPLAQDPTLLTTMNSAQIEAAVRNLNISLDMNNPTLLEYKEGLQAAFQYPSMAGAPGSSGGMMTTEEANASFSHQLLLQPPQFPFGQAGDINPPLNFSGDLASNYLQQHDSIFLPGGEQPDLPQCGLETPHGEKPCGVVVTSKKSRNLKNKKVPGGAALPGGQVDPLSGTQTASTSTDPNASPELFANQLDAANPLCQLSSPTSGAFGPAGQGGGSSPILDLNSETDSNHDTALTLACAGGHEDLVTLLLRRGADIEHRDKKGFTPLILAATAGHDKVVEILLLHSAAIEAQSERTKDTPLSLACSGGRYEVVEILLSRNANKEHRNVSDYTPLSLGASGGYVEIIKLLLSHGAEINSRTGSKLGISPLMLAAMNGHTAAVKLLLDMGSDINAQIETNRNTALTLACFQGRHEVVSLLLDRKANVEHRAKTGLTPLMEAASGGYVVVGRVLLDKGADVNAPPVPSSRDTALTIAADKGHYRFVELLLSRRAQVDVRNKKGNSSLWLACNGGHLDVVQLLYSAGADIDSQDNRKVSCLMAAFRKGHHKVVKWMVKHVTQFPSDQELTRYIATISVTDKELLKKTEQCKEIIRVAKERQAAEAAKNACILLEELDRESKLEQSKKEAAARKREKKKRKKLEKMGKNPNHDKEDDKEEEEEEEEGSKPDDDEDKENARGELHRLGEEGLRSAVTPEDPKDKSVDDVINEGDSGIDANSQGSAASHESGKKDADDAAMAVGTSNNKKKKNKKSKNKEKEKNERNQELESVKEEPVFQLLPAAVRIEERKESSLEISRVPKTPEGHSVTFSGPSGHHSEQETKGRGGKVISSTNGAPAVRPNRQQLAEKNHGFNLTPTAAGGGALSGPTGGTSPKKPGMSRTGLHGSSEKGAGSGDKQSLASDPASAGWKEVVRKSKKVSVPSNAISRVIGRGGCNINAIRELSGAHIEVEKQSSKGGVDRTILIKGSADATRQANTWIQEIINSPEKDMADIIGRPFKQLQQQQQSVGNAGKQQPQPLMAKLAAQPASTKAPPAALASGLAKSNSGSTGPSVAVSGKSLPTSASPMKPTGKVGNASPTPFGSATTAALTALKPGKSSTSFAAVAGGSDASAPVGMIATGAQRPMGSFNAAPMSKRDVHDMLPVVRDATSVPSEGLKNARGGDGFAGYTSNTGSSGNHVGGSNSGKGPMGTADGKEFSPFQYNMGWEAPSGSNNISDMNPLRFQQELNSNVDLPNHVDHQAKAPGFNRTNIGSPAGGSNWLNKSPGSDPSNDGLYQTQERCNSAPGTPMSPTMPPTPIGPPSNKSTLSPGSDPDQYVSRVPHMGAPGSHLGRSRFSPVGLGSGSSNYGRALTPDSEMDHHHLRGLPVSVGLHSGTNRPSSVTSGLENFNPRDPAIYNLASQLSNYMGGNFNDLMPGPGVGSSSGNDYLMGGSSRFSNPPSMSLMSQQPPKLNPNAPDFMRPPSDSFRMGGNMSGPPPPRMTAGHYHGGVKSQPQYYGGGGSSGGGVNNPTSFGHPNQMHVAMSALTNQSINSLIQQGGGRHHSHSDMNYDFSDLEGRSLSEFFGGTESFNAAIPPPTTMPPPFMDSPPVGPMDNGSRAARPIGSERRGPQGGAQPPQPPHMMKPSSWAMGGAHMFDAGSAHDLTNGGGIPPSLTGQTLSSFINEATGNFNGGQSSGFLDDCGPLRSGLQSPATSIGMSPNITPTKRDFGGYMGGSAGKKAPVGGPQGGYGDLSSAKRNINEQLLRKSWEN